MKIKTVSLMTNMPLGHRLKSSKKKMRVESGALTHIHRGLALGEFFILCRSPSVCITQVKNVTTHCAVQTQPEETIKPTLGKVS